MDTEKALQAAQELLAPWATSTATPETERLDVVVDPANVVPAVTALIEKRWGYLSALSGVDLGLQAGHLEMIYHFCGNENAAVLNLRVHTPRENASVPSVCGPIPSASLYERELMEMLGVTVVGTPNTDRLFLAENWPDDVHPLRKEFAAHGPAETAE